MSNPLPLDRAWIFRWSAPILALPLTGCNWVVMNPSGDIAVQQRDLILISTALMLLIVVPVMALVVFFAWRYRAANQAADKDYDPDWDHSTKLELLIWSAPLLIIICLGALTWVSTHKLDPYRPLERIDARTAIDPKVKPLTIEVVALDWKWLFIYPEQGIATVNELVVPAGTPVNFRLTSATVWNSFFVPQFGSMIYTMPRMTTRLNLQADRPGVYDGLSSHFSGDGFPGMQFKVQALPPEQFAMWAQGARGQGGALDGHAYGELSRPSSYVKPTTYGAVAPGLYDAIVADKIAQLQAPQAAPPPERDSASPPGG